ncbi:MAG TPA: hypothetical protein VMT73_14820 [Anaerolineales bacterium]|nr:hypothetical protein [Anaerolineales bacterium]
MTKRKLTSNPEEEFDSIEAHLAGTLRRVQPSKEIIYRLRGRLRMPQREQIVVRLRDWQSLLLAFGSVMSGLLLTITVARAFFHFFGRRTG